MSTSAQEEAQHTLPDDIYQILPGTQFVLETKSYPERFATRFIGGLRGQYFLCKTPSIAEYPTTLERLYKGEELIVRFLSRGKAWAFASKVLGRIAKPQPLLFLEFPKAVDSYNLRSSKRIVCYFPVTALINGASPDGVILDLSETGCRLTAPVSVTDLHIGDQIGIDCPVFKATGKNRIIAKIQRITQANGTPELGLAFEDIHPQIHEEILHYIQHSERISVNRT